MSSKPRRGLEQLADEDTELVAGTLDLGGNTPVLGQAVAVVQPEDRLRVADVDVAAQQGARLELLFFAAERLAELLRERFGVSAGPSPSPRNSSIVTSLDV